MLLQMVLLMLKKQEYANAFEVDRTSDTEFTLENGTTETVTGALKFGGKTYCRC